MVMEIIQEEKLLNKKIPVKIIPDEKLTESKNYPWSSDKSC